MNCVLINSQYILYYKNISLLKHGKIDFKELIDMKICNKAFWEKCLFPKTIYFLRYKSYKKICLKSRKDYCYHLLGH